MWAGHGPVPVVLGRALGHRILLRPQWVLPLTDVSLTPHLCHNCHLRQDAALGGRPGCTSLTPPPLGHQGGGPGGREKAHPRAAFPGVKTLLQTRESRCAVSWTGCPVAGLAARGRIWWVKESALPGVLACHLCWARHSAQLRDPGHGKGRGPGEFLRGPWEILLRVMKLSWGNRDTPCPCHLSRHLSQSGTNPLTHSFTQSRIRSHAIS